jgi:hypothetical protein
MLNALAGAFNQTRYYLESGTEIAIYQRAGDAVPGKS